MISLLSPLCRTKKGLLAGPRPPTYSRHGPFSDQESKPCHDPPASEPTPGSRSDDLCAVLLIDLGTRLSPPPVVLRTDCRGSVMRSSMQWRQERPSQSGRKDRRARKSRSPPRNFRGNPIKGHTHPTSCVCGVCTLSYIHAACLTPPAAWFDRGKKTAGPARRTIRAGIRADSSPAGPAG